MWINVRTVDGKRTVKIDGLSKLTKIENLRELIKEKFEVDVERQRLFYSGKQLVDGHTLFDYNVSLNSIIQLMERVVFKPEVQNESDNTEVITEPKEKDVDNASENSNVSDSDSGIDEEAKKAPRVRLLPSIGRYKINELVDAQDKNMGAWFEAIVMKVEKKESKHNVENNTENHEKVSDNSDDFCKPVVIQKQTSMESFVEVKGNDSDENKENVAPSKSHDKASTSKPAITTNNSSESELLYHVKFEEYDEIHILPSNMIRPRARKLLKWSEFDVGDVIMANYNIDKPKERGFWYDCIVIKMNERRKYKELKVQILLSPDKTLQPCKIVFVEEIFHIEEPGVESIAGDEQQVPAKRSTMTDPECTHCNDQPQRNCKECGCNVCGEKKEFDKTLLCDECNLPFHTFCLDPPLDGLPDDEDWYCPHCRNDHSNVINVGDKLKISKKKSKMKSATSTTQRDWGKGMACVGRSKICSIVPSHHFGPIPGIPVGTLWKFRVQVSEAGVHRPHVSGIHGKGTDACYSIVLAGGYEDDEDNGEEFTYTGSGGRDLSGNKRTAEQSCDQVLTKSNMSIARSCDSKLDSKNGNTAIDWKKGSPIRVVRNYKGAKHSEYAPEDGNRYDGIYKVVKYWPDKGKSGFIVWRYLFRRDDTEAAPWTKEGKKRAKELGLTLQYPEGYLEAQASKEEENNDKKGKKRKRESEIGTTSPNKKIKASTYKIPNDIKPLIKSDEPNSKLWNEVMKIAKEGQKKFFEKLEEAFTCICCQDVVCQPITTECNHNICKSCLKRSFNAEVYSCPTCRFEFGKAYKSVVNDNLRQALVKFFPGYENGR